MPHDEGQRSTESTKSLRARFTDPRVRAKWLVLQRYLIVTFCLYHMAAVLAFNLPARSPFGGELREPFTSYILYNGLWQYWAMFETIPRYRSVHPRLVAKYEDGSLKTFGPMLPGLKRYRHSTRISALFTRYAIPENEFASHVRAYLDLACAAVTKKTGKKPKQMAIRLDSETLSPLASVRATGRMAEHVETYGPTVADCR